MSTPAMSAPPPVPPVVVKTSSRRGCLIAVLIVVVLLLAACVGGCVWVSMNPTKFLTWGFGKATTAMESAIAPDVPEDVKARFQTEKAAFVEYLNSPAANEALKAGNQAIPQAVQYAAQTIQDKQVTADELEQFITQMRAARGADAP